MADDENRNILLDLYEDLLGFLTQNTASWRNPKTQLPEKIPEFPYVPDDKLNDPFFKTFQEHRLYLQENFNEYLKALKKAESCSMVLKSLWKLRKKLPPFSKQLRDSECAEKHEYSKHLQVLKAIDDFLSKDTEEKGEKSTKSSENRVARIGIQDDQSEGAAQTASVEERPLEKVKDTEKEEDVEKLKSKEMQKTLEEMTAELMSLKQRENQYQVTIKRYEEQAEQLKPKKKPKSSSVEKEANERKFRECQSELDEYKNKCKKADTNIKKLEQMLKTTKEELEKAKLKNKNPLKEQQKRPQTAPVRSIRDMQDEMEKLLAEKTYYMNQSKALRGEKDSLMQRLSKIAGTKMKDNNPTIADLSDPNRPERLSEQFREIYDNSWTDLLDKLNEVTGESDEVCVKQILETLKDIYTVCVEQIRQRKKGMLKYMGYKEGEFTNLYSGGKQGHDPGVKIVKDLIKQSVDRIMESIAEHVEENENVKNILKNGGKSAKTFVSKCTGICIYMCVQDPPVVLDFSFTSGKPFDVDRLNPFTKSGDVIDYVVWPAMFLYQNGTMMSKGIAQGMTKSSREKEGLESEKVTSSSKKGNSLTSQTDEKDAMKMPNIENDENGSDDDNDVVTGSKKENKSVHEVVGDNVKQQPKDSKHSKKERKTGTEESKPEKSQGNDGKNKQDKIEDNSRQNETGTDDGSEQNEASEYKKRR